MITHLALEKYLDLLERRALSGATRLKNYIKGYLTYQRDINRLKSHLWLLTEQLAAQRSSLIASFPYRRPERTPHF
ncbi:hypothetical protein [secondary endosymbiont of Ctenarytaina eucalypti]|uniref:Uncharacterized protein n=1 Tax=secondary endosymbiont of Ctenarytaina eucalypti TaxID=1199245 RepID=J3TXH5_9ENTR|nr:hypothetical protein [secondary endosymbiont of Ctenarytaina eucalypti]AFP84865.1 hypothetical protein A359_04720 [secondary endosymbiont of Ctenarytaina eucalypti]